MSSTRGSSRWTSASIPCLTIYCSHYAWFCQFHHSEVRKDGCKQQLLRLEAPRIGCDRRSVIQKSLITICHIHKRMIQCRVYHSHHHANDGGLQQRDQRCCTLRSGLHEIPKMIRTFSHGLENNHASKWVSDNFPGMLTYILFLEYCLKSIFMHGC